MLHGPLYFIIFFKNKFLHIFFFILGKHFVFVSQQSWKKCSRFWVQIQSLELKIAQIVETKSMPLWRSNKIYQYFNGWPCQKEALHAIFLFASKIQRFLKHSFAYWVYISVFMPTGKTLGFFILYLHSL